MTVLVTGGTGLIGSRLIPRLVAEGIVCRVLTRSGKEGPAEAETIYGNVLDPSSLAAALPGVEAIVHLAAVLRTPEAEQIWQVNAEGTRNLIAAVEKHAPDARFIMASTGLVYSKDGTKPAKEIDKVAPDRDYPASKVAAENLLRASNLNWSILRFGFVYGDGDGHIGQIPHLAKLLKLHPANRLSLIHHRDIAHLVMMALNGVLDGRTVNTVDDSPLSILELSSMTGAPIDTIDTPLIQPWSGVMDGALARELGFKPEVSTAWQAAREGKL